MPRNWHYLDYNARAPLRDCVKHALVQAMDIYGNPSSVHSVGRQARQHLEDVRERIARMVQVPPHLVTFVSCATEANVTILRGIAAQRVIVSAADHESIWQAAHQLPITVDVCKVDTNGHMCLQHLSDLLSQNVGKTLLCTTAVNSETGVVQPLAQIEALCQDASVHWHIDAVQAVGKLPAQNYALYGHSQTIAFHKMGGGNGVAILVHRQELTDFMPLLHGGGQEQNKRAGTHHVLAIAGIGALLQHDTQEMWLQEQDTNAAYRQTFENTLQQAGARIIGAQAQRVGNTSCVVINTRLAEHTVIAADLAGVCISAGSACSSGKTKRSRFLQAMGYERESMHAVRVSGGFATTAADWQQAAQVLTGLA